MLVWARVRQPFTLAADRRLQIFQRIVIQFTGTNTTPGANNSPSRWEGKVISECPKHRAQKAILRKRRRRLHDFGRTLNATDALTALARAWTVTTIATALLLAALAIAPVWDSDVFLKALNDELSDPQ
jgi:hypothetical protein